MNSKTIAIRCASTATFLVAALCATGAGAAESLTLTGKGTYFVNRDLLPLANGGAALHIAATTVVSAEPSESGIMFGECAGLAYMDTADKASYRSRIYCNFTENGQDTFTVQGDMSEGEGKMTVIGGSGRFEGATGDGALKPLGEDEGQGRYSYEFRINLP